MRRINNHLVNAHDAIERAQQSNNAALHSRGFRSQRDRARKILEDWREIFNSSPAAILLALFSAAVIIEISFSFPMYTDLMSTFSKRGSSLLALLAGALFVFLGAYVSALIAKRLSPAVFDFNLYNRMEAIGNSSPQLAEEERLLFQSRREFYYGIACGLVLLYIVAAMSWQRVWLLGAINGATYGFIHRIIPVLCVLIEIIAGIYIDYFVKRLRKQYEVYRNHLAYCREKAICVYETRMTYEFNKKASEGGEHLLNSKEMRDAVYRFENRTHDNDNYVDTIPEQKYLKIVVMDGDSLVEGVLLKGMLTPGVVFDSIYTNGSGEGMLIWEGTESEVLAISADQELYPGPYRANTTVPIRLKRVKKIKVA